MIERLWIDVETTGVNPETDTVIELAAIYPGSKFHMYCKPKEKPDGFEKITEITGITWEFLEKNGVTERILYNEFLNFLDSLVSKFDKSDKLIFSGYNTRFDNNFIRELFLRNDNTFFGSYFLSILTDVMSSVANEIASGRLELLKNYKLQTVCNHYGVEFSAHSAIEDIHATIELYKKIRELYT